jgi:hypothetical protein
MLTDSKAQRPRRLPILSATCAALLACGVATAQQRQDNPNTLQDRSHSRDANPGETLSDRLDRNKGVIRPPTNVDPKMAVPAPKIAPDSTPVIPPPGTSGGDRVVPK